MRKPLFFLLSLVFIVSCGKSEDDTPPEPIQSLQIENLATTISENPDDNELIGTFSIMSQNLTGPINYVLTEVSVAGSVTVDSAGNLRVAEVSAFDYEVQTSITGMVRVSSGALSDTASFAITIADIDEPIVFISQWEVEPGFQQIQLPIYQGSGADVTTYDFEVDWGDGTISAVTSYDDPDAIHQYDSPGVKTITITGFLTGFSFGQTPDSKTNFIDVIQWGGLKPGNAGRNFEGCFNLADFSATDAPDLNGVSNMDFMFSDARLFNGDISHWDLSDATSTIGMFISAEVFNQDISAWDVSNVVFMTGMFAEADSFNQDISDWDVGSVTDMEAMFGLNDVFNQDISAWDMSNVRELRAMFSGAVAFNQDLSAWDVSNALDMGLMFSDAILFNQDLSSWDVSKVESMDAMFRGATSFDQDLSQWPTDNVVACEEFALDSAMSPEDLPTRGCFAQ